VELSSISTCYVFGTAETRPKTSVCGQASARIVGKRKSVVANLKFDEVFGQVPR
jgi:hypothetical protein